MIELLAAVKLPTAEDAKDAEVNSKVRQARKLSTTEDTEVKTSVHRILGVLGVLCGGGVLFVSTGCGYSLAGRGSFLPAHVMSIGIPTFANRSTVFNLETLLTEKVRSEFIGRGKFQVLPEGTGVDALLIGDIASVAVVPASFNSQQLASRYVITVTANIQLRDLVDNKVLWENPSLVFRQEYEAQSGQTALDPAAFFGQDQNALERMTTDWVVSPPGKKCTPRR